MKTTLNLGDLVKDTITGFKGVVVAKTEWLNNCVRLTVQPKELKNGRPIESESFDETQLVLVKAGPRHEPVTHGGPRPEPRRERDPR